MAATCCSDEMVEMYNQFCKNYPVISIEDPFDQDDSASSTKFTAEGVCQVPAYLSACPPITQSMSIYCGGFAGLGTPGSWI